MHPCGPFVTMGIVVWRGKDYIQPVKRGKRTEKELRVEKTCSSVVLEKLLQTFSSDKLLIVKLLSNLL